jgi:SDR family mycofactocin-dependent oxidoreductase
VTRVALVTGAARGIGAATVRALVAEGWAVVATDRCSDDPRLRYPMGTRVELEALASDMVVPFTADTTTPSDLAAAVALAEERFGGLDAALAVAGGISGGQPVWETGDAVWSTMLGVNVEGVWRLARSAVPALLARPTPRNGRFVAVASAGGTLGLPLLAAYSAAKHAVIGLTRSLAAELGPEGITVNAVAPGSTSTAMLDASAAIYGLDGTAEFASHHQLGRLVEPDEVAAALAWLCSADSSAVTGAVLAVDAGMTAS